MAIALSTKVVHVNGRAGDKSQCERCTQSEKNTDDGGGGVGGATVS